MDPGKRPAPEPPAQPPPDLPVPLQPPQQQQQQQPVHVIQNPAPVVQIQGDPSAAAAPVPVPVARVAPPPPLPPPPPVAQQQQQQAMVYQPPSPTFTPPPFNVASVVPVDVPLNGHSSYHHRSSPSQSLQRKRQSAAKVAHQLRSRIAEKQAMLKQQAEEMRDKMLDEAGAGEPGAGEQNVGVIGADESDSGIGICGWLLTMISWGIVAITLPFSLFVCFKVVQEYERAVIFRLGRLLSGGSRGPGIFFVLPCIESYQKVDLRTITLGVPPQEVLTKDSVTVSVDAVVYYRVSNATVSVANVENAHHSTRLLAQTTLRNILGTKNLHEILSDRESISGSMQVVLDEATTAWGIKVERVEIKDARLPVQLQRAMAAEAEAAREARAKVIAAEGEQKASRALKEASEVIAESSSALQLRYLQTLNSISAEKNSTIIFPLPIDFITHFMKDGSTPKGEKED